MPNFFAPVRQLLVPAMACALLGTTCRALADSSPPLRIDIEVLPTREYADVTIHNDSKEPIVTFQLNCAPLRPFFVSIKLEGESEFRPIGRGPGDITDAEFADRAPHLIRPGEPLGLGFTVDRSTGLELKPGAKFLMNLEYGLHDRGGYGLRVENLEGALDEKGYFFLDSGPQTKVTYLAPIKPLWSPEYEKKVIERKLVYREEPTKPNSEPVRPPHGGKCCGTSTPREASNSRAPANEVDTPFFRSKCRANPQTWGRLNRRSRIRKRWQKQWRCIMVDSGGWVGTAGDGCVWIPEVSQTPDGFAVRGRDAFPGPESKWLGPGQRSAWGQGE